MPEANVKKRAMKDKAEGKASSTQAGEFVREEIHHVREGKHGARSPKQAIAIGLSKARKAGVALLGPSGRKGTTKKKTTTSSGRGTSGGTRKAKETAAPSPRRSRAVTAALKREGSGSASKGALSRQTKAAASRRAPSERSLAAKKGAKTKGATERSAAAKKGAKTRAATED